MNVEENDLPDFDSPAKEEVAEQGVELEDEASRHAAPGEELREAALHQTPPSGEPSERPIVDDRRRR
jgi:hypothetical protein